MVTEQWSAYRHKAFVSYSHEDMRPDGKSWGEWLEERLEAFRVPKELVGEWTPWGPVPANLRPVFRDRSGFGAASSLTDAIRAALDDSAALIVVCSPAAARSEYVNDEVQYFKASGRAERVFAFIVAGSPDEGAQDQCFPLALRKRVSTAPSNRGAILEADDPPIGADARLQGDGPEAALIKLMAGLLGVRPTDLQEKTNEVLAAEARRARIMRNVFAGLALSAVLALAALAFTFYEFRAVKEEAIRAETRLKGERRTEQVAEAALNGVAQLVANFMNEADKLGLKSDQLKAVLGGAQDIVDAVLKEDVTTPQLKYDLADFLISYSVYYGRVGDTHKQLQDAEQARDILVELVKTNPSAEWKDELSVSWERIGDVHQAQGDLKNALDAYNHDLAIAKRLAVSDPGNPGWQRDLSVSWEKIGDVRMAEGDLKGALDVYQASLEIRKRLAASDPGNAGWQNDLAVSWDRIGTMRQAQGDLKGALDAYRSSLDIMKRLGASDPGNAGWQRDLSVSWEKIGDVRVAQGDLKVALAAYQHDLDIAKRLAASDPGNAGWQRDLSVSWERIGDVLVAQGDLKGALKAYQAELDIMKRLAASDPGNAGWQDDLQISYFKVGTVKEGQGKLTEAASDYHQAEAIVQSLIKKHSSNGRWKEQLAEIEAAIKRVESGKPGKPSAALAPSKSRPALAEGPLPKPPALGFSDTPDRRWGRRPGPSLERLP